MHKKFLALLLGVLILLGGLVACREEAPEQTTTAATVLPGLNTRPSGFVGFDDSTDPTDGSADPAETTEATEFPVPPETKPTEPAVTDPQPTTPPDQPTDSAPTDPKPTDPVQTPELPQVSIAPDAEGFLQYRNSSASEQYAFFKEFGGDPAAFDLWLDTAEAAFRAKYPDVEYDGSGPIILPEG